jgi:pimeloyl-ACP methyl ester carboxylesterase
MIVEYYMRAALAEAAYADLEGVTVADDLSSALQRIGEKPGEPDDPNKGFSLSQANDFASHWRVAHHLPNTNTGFSATVFESIDNPGEYVFAMRGTETALDTVIDDAVLADIADIGADGIALKQAMDLINYYQRLTTSESELAYQYNLYEGDQPPPEGIEYIEYEDGIPFTGTQYRYLIPADPLQGLAVIPDSVAKIDVTGHSLGGHLALIMSRLDPNRINQVFTYNAPGFDTGIGPDTGPIGSNDTEWFFQAMAQVETIETGMTTVGSFPVGRINNLAAMYDQVSEIGYVPGNIIPFADEGDNIATAHYMYNATDFLAVCNLFAAIDPSVDITDELTPVFIAAEEREKLSESLERLI